MEDHHRIASFLDIEELNFLSRDDMMGYDERPDFMISSQHLKDLLSVPYNKEKPISLKVEKQGDTLKVNKMPIF